jgi:hypothetical protein
VSIETSIMESYRTFGFVVCRGVFKSDDLNIMKEEALRLVKQESEAQSLDDAAQSGVKPVAAPIEKSDPLATLFFNSSAFQIVRWILKDSFYFFSSHLSVFGGSSSWHRDTYFPFSWLKANIYLESLEEGGIGEFCLLPGSHLHGSAFADRATDGINWPSYREKKINYFNNIDLTSGVVTFDLPYAKICLSPGDVLLFDTRLIHNVVSQSSRRSLIGINFVDRSPKWFTQDFRVDSFSPLDFYKARLLIDQIEGGLYGRSSNLNYPSNFFKRYEGTFLKKFMLEDISEVQYEELRTVYFKSKSPKALHDMLLDGMTFN